MFQTLVLTCRCILNAKGTLCHRHRICNPFWGCPSCRWIALFLKERTDRTDPGYCDTCVPIYCHFRIWSRETHTLSLCASFCPFFRWMKFRALSRLSSFSFPFFSFFFFFFFKGILSDEMEFILRLTREIYKKCHSRIQVTRSIKFIEVPTLFREELKFRDFKIHQSSD